MVEPEQANYAAAHRRGQMVVEQPDMLSKCGSIFRPVMQSKPGSRPSSCIAVVRAKRVITSRLKTDNNRQLTFDKFYPLPLRPRRRL
jgi:hypothetical protein